MARVLRGRVVSDKASKTIVVAVLTSKTHPVLRKKYSRSKRFMAHDEKDEARVGDQVSIVETRPLSARKRFALMKIIEKAAIAESDLVENVTKEPEEVVVKPEKPAAAVKKASKKETEKSEESEK